MDSIEIQVAEADRVSIWVLTDNYYDSLRPDSTVARRFRVTPGRSVHAEHGLAYYIQADIDGEKSVCMFDFGLDPAGVLNNLELLGLDVGTTDAFALSHGHLDHWTAADKILQKNRDAIADLTPFYVGREAFLHRYSLIPGTGQTLDLGRLDRTAIEASGVAVKEVTYPMGIIPGGYLSGNIVRTTPYETTSTSLLVERDGRLEPDDFRGEQALFFNVKNKGLVVVSGCAHAGIINTIRHIQKISGVEKIHAVLGGFHLINATEERIWNTIADMQSLNPDIVVPAHCTGFEAVTSFLSSMPDAFQLSTAGTQYIFEAGSPD